MLRFSRMPAFVLAGLMFAGAGAGCKDTFGGHKEAAADKPLFERLGGHKAVVAVIDDFVGRAAKDEKVNFFRKGTGHEWKPSPAEVDRLKVLLVQFVEKNTGGPQVYEGRDMVTTHTGMKISNAEFDALAGDLKATLDQFKVPAKEQGELLAIVGSTRGDIVDK